MNTFKRAILYLTRKRGRAAILLIVFLVMAVFSMACLSVREAAILEMSRLRKSLASNFTMQLNSEKVMKELNFTSLKFNRLDDMLDSVGIDKCKLCTYCWDGKE